MQNRYSGDPVPEPAYPAPAGPAWWPRPSAGQWEPVIVGDPIVAFEPKPAPPDMPVPDTEFDGWSTPRVTLRMASVRGYSHRYYGKPRQDHATATVHQASNTVVFAVADGVSGARRPELGARQACAAAVEALLTRLDDGRTPDLVNAIRAAAARLMGVAAQLHGVPHLAAPAVEALLATTLVVGTAAPIDDGLDVSVARVGDSEAWILHEGRYYSVLGTKHDPHAAVVTSAVRPLPRLPEPLEPERFLLPPGDVLLVGTDGFGDPLGDGDGEVGQLFADMLATAPPALGLAHLLDFSRETFDDDRTLMALWPRTGDAPARHAPTNGRAAP